MSWLDRLLNRKLPASPSTQQVRSEPGPVTSHEAWSLALPAARRLDPDARLVLITSGTDLQSDGRSFTWEFLLQLPTRKARVLLSCAPLGTAPSPDDAPIVLTQRVSPDAEPGPIAALPLEFRNSPEVVAELARSGVDFVAGPTDLKLEARVGPSGRPEWVTYYWSEERRVPF